MRGLVPLTLLLLAAVAVAQWALDPSTGYRGWTLSTNATLPTTLSATVQLLPTPFWQEWILGNWTTAFKAGRGCTIQAGPLRYGIYVSHTAFIETPAVRLGQNFTVVVTFKPRYLVSDEGSVMLWWKSGGTGWWGEISASYYYRPPPQAYFYVNDNAGGLVSTFANINPTLLTISYVGTYISSQNTYYIYIYVGGALVAQRSFSGQRGVITSSTFRLGTGGAFVQQHLWYVAFAVYNRSLSAAEVAGWRPEAPAGGNLVVYYYAHPQFVHDVDGDGVLEWLDLSGNNRHARLRNGAVPQWFVEPVALQTQQCGGVSLTAQWDGFTAVYTVNGTQRSAFEPGRVHFDGRTGYAFVPISFYGWQGLTIEQYVYVPPCKPNTMWSKSSAYGSWTPNNTYTYFVTSNVFCRSTYSYALGYRRPDGVQRDVVWTWLSADRWQHVVLTFNRTTMTARIYVNGTLRSQGTWDYQYTIFDYPPSTVWYSMFALGANQLPSEQWTTAYTYVRIYSRELSQDEIRWNMQNPNSPVTRDLEAWLHWDSFRGNTWLDKSGHSRHASVHGTVFSYPDWRWTVGAYLQHGYPAASPLVVTDFKFNGVPWTSGVSRGGAASLTRVDGAYIDAAAGTGGGWAVNRYAAPNAAFGFDAAWTPSDHFAGWITLWRVGATALNITQMGGHGVSLNATSVRGYVGVVAAVLGDGLYVNGTRRASLPQGSTATSFSMLPNAQGGVRALVRYAWLDGGVRYGANSSLTYGGFAGVVYTPAHTPSPWAYYVDFRWWPPVATWGILQNPPLTAARQRAPSQPLVPAVLDGAYATSQSAWGPFGEVCVGATGGQRYVFGARHVWLSDETPTCVLPLATAPSSTASPASHVVGRLPPVVPWQHPALVNSVPRVEPWLVDYSAPYVDASNAVQIPYAARACAASFCIQGGRVAGAYGVYFTQPGQALNRTGYVYVFDRFGVSVIDSVAYVTPLRGYALVLSRDAHLPGVTVVANNAYYNAWVEYEPKHAAYFPAASGNYVEVGDLPMDRFTVVAVVAKPDRSRGTGSEFLWRGVHVGGGFHVYATLNHDDATALCIVDSANSLRCVTAQNVFSDVFNVVAYVVDGGRLEVYVNGRLAASGSFSRRVDQYFLRFGERNTGTAYPFYVHAIYVYTRPLAPEEVLSFRPESPPRGGLAAWYVAETQFFTGDRWFDASGNSRHASVVGNVRLVQVAWPRGVGAAGQPAQAHVGPLPGPPSASVAQAVAAVYVETDGDVAASTWTPYGGGFEYKTGGYGRGVVPVFGYVGDMVAATAKVDLAVYGIYAFLVRRGDVHVYSFATELGGSRLDVPIRVPYPGYYALDVFYNGTKIRSSTYWVDQGGALYLGVLGPPLALIPAQPVQPPTATPIYASPLQPLQWLPRDLPLPAAVRSNPIEVSAAAALAVALAAAYVTYASSRRLELGLAAAVVAFFASVTLLLPAEHRWVVSGWAAFLVTVAVLLIVYYLTK